jgi:uncharacterized membrane protein
MKIIGLIIGLTSGAATGFIVGLFSGNTLQDVVIGAFISGFVGIILFKDRVQQTGNTQTDDLFESRNSKVIMSNSWVFWIGNFLSALFVSAFERLEYFWGGFVSCSISIIIAMISTSIFSLIFGKIKK